MHTYPGIYLAKVVSAVDTEKRFRAQIRVAGVHARGLPDEGLPWAEYCALTGRGRGDFFPFHTGDEVFVMFMEGDSSRPVVVGGRVSTNGGVTDAPIPYQTDVTIDDSVSDYKRWERVDSADNRVVLSEKAGELHVLLQSGGASVEVTQRSNTIYLRASGAVIIESPSATVNAGTANVNAGTVNIEATDGDAEFHSSSSDVLINAAPIGVLNPSGGDVNIGGTVPRLRGIPLPPLTPNTLPEQSGRTNIRSQVINIGAGVGGVLPLATSSSELFADFDGIIPVAPTIDINLRCTGKVNLHTTGSVDVNGATGVAVKSAGAVSVTSATASVTASTASVTAPGGITLTGPTSVNGTLNVSGTVTAVGTVTALDFATALLPSYALHTHTSGYPLPASQTAPPTLGT